MTQHALMHPDESTIAALLRSAKRVAVLGIKTERQAEQPAFYVPKYLHDAGLDVIPVPVYYPNVTHILGREVVRRLIDVAPPVDIVNVFRRPEDVTGHLDDMLKARPRAVWLQSGIRNDAVAAQLAAAGIIVVQDRCIMVDHRRLL